MTPLALLRLQVRSLQARVDALERARPARPKKTSVPGAKRGYVNIPQAESDKRWNQWATYHGLRILEVFGTVYNRRRGDLLPTSRAWFAANARDEEGKRFSLRELERWFSARNTFPVGSRQDLRFRGAIQREIDRLHRAGYYIGMPQPEIERLHATAVM